MNETARRRRRHGEIRVAFDEEPEWWGGGTSLDANDEKGKGTSRPGQTSLKTREAEETETRTTMTHTIHPIEARSAKLNHNAYGSIEEDSHHSPSQHPSSPSNFEKDVHQPPHPSPSIHQPSSTEAIHIHIYASVHAYAPSSSTI
ncbi:hypothetical protein CC1G_14920 [Coprinopsis cinerea okayama7|uniref:Uncharacterized protein n=1 Tax=Coprinopsis cinerea (strain Okayama-7 / 130 / ATCC MYA-4618 / FGSC 9003) TaxID=240176 RepID=D6RNY5_COPC7|nr:hypothetical protein CC1G_14920 [Coprinopsis cinerea okayama7\|eukprot:XP_002910942.1 hypothetical protein CC1G_14920 [Coprinopsis cinerea okayama7\